MKRRCITPDEYDCYTEWRRLIGMDVRAGVTSRVKRATRRRERRELHAELEQEIWDWEGGA